ncbi:MAG: hypothetical protein JWR18_2456 [Segetibacter sp.]|jgi:hypothetical protein|nr:hypothetical protein [Segetibacter sp.]
MSVLKRGSFVLALLFCIAFKPFHHGWANYDQDKTLDYQGTIEEAVYENPHATAKVKNKDKTWVVILAPVSRMSARGVTENMLKKGAAIQVVGYPHKEIENEMRAERVFINGNKYELR